MKMPSKPAKLSDRHIAHLWLWVSLILLVLTFFLDKNKLLLGLGFLCFAIALNYYLKDKKRKG